METVQLHITLLGTLRVMHDTRPVVDGAAGKVWALLAYLATESERAHRREHLATMLWPDQSDRTARQNLRWALATLRREIADQDAEPPFLFVTRETIQFNRNSSSIVDVHILIDELAALPPDPGTPLHAVQAKQLAVAVERYTHDFLENFVLDESVTFEEWVIVIRERLRQQVLDALAALVAYHAQQSEHHVVQRYARRWLELEPWNEQAHRALMLALAQSGQRAAALDQYRVCWRVLDAEFGMEPEPATTHLHNQLKQSAPPDPPQPPTTLPSATPMQATSLSTAPLPELVSHTTEAQPAAQNGMQEPPEDLHAALQKRDRHSLADVSDRNRRMMLQRVQTIWIEGLLERVKQTVARIDLHLVQTPAPVDIRLNTQYQELLHDPEPVPPGVSISTVFEQTGEALLILGEPGAGKTTLLLELCRELLDVAVHDLTAPMPVVFNLSSWAAQQHSLSTWLAEELTMRYDIPAHIASAWIEQDRVLPLLDGLDEVQSTEQIACVDAINTYHQEHLVPLAVCARQADYMALPRKLALQQAVIIQPLTDEQIAGYVQAGGNTLVWLGETLQQDSELRALASTPLMLNVMALACTKHTSNLITPAMSPQQQRAALFAAYTERVLNRRGARTPYTPDQTMHWLRWLARQMLDRNQSIFLIEQLQPEWLTNSQQVKQYVLSDRIGWGGISAVFLLLCVGLLFWALGHAAAGIVLAVACSLAAGLVIGLFGPPPAMPDLKASRLRGNIVSALQGWLLIAPTTGIMAALCAALLLSSTRAIEFGIEVGSVCGMGGVFAGLLLGPPRLGPRRIVPIETVSWSWAQFRAHVWGAVLLGGLIGAIFQFMLPVNAHYVGIIEGMLMGLVASIFAGIKGDVLEQQVYPNQGIRRSAHSALVSGGIAALLTITIVLVHNAMRPELHVGLAGLLNDTLGELGIIGMSLVLGLGLGFGTAFARGGCAVLSHIALRFVLWRSNTMPWNYVRFLDYCAARILLRKIGGGYAFMHRTLLEHFATLDDAELERLAAAARSAPDRAK
jgi:DNA-binding SARP family transcriptional activator